MLALVFSQVLMRKVRVYINPVNSDPQLDIRYALDRVIKLDQNFDISASHRDAESENLCNEWQDISNKIVLCAPSNEDDINIKLKFIAMLNKMEALTAKDRIDEADSMHDRIAWSIIRDLVEVRLSPS